MWWWYDVTLFSLMTWQIFFFLLFFDAIECAASCAARFLLTQLLAMVNKPCCQRIARNKNEKKSILYSDTQCVLRTINYETDRGKKIKICLMPSLFGHHWVLNTIQCAANRDTKWCCCCCYCSLIKLSFPLLPRFLYPFLLMVSSLFFQCFLWKNFTLSREIPQLDYK